MMILLRPEATASSITYWMIGLSTRGSISLGWALVAGRKRVPRPAAGNTALRVFFVVAMRALSAMLSQGLRRTGDGPRAMLRDRAGLEVRGREPRARALDARAARGEPRADRGLARARVSGPLGPRRRAPRHDPEGRAASAPAEGGRGGDRPPGPRQGRRLRAEGGDEGRLRRDQERRRAAARDRGQDPRVPPRRAQRARRERPRGEGRVRERRGAASGGAAAVRLRAQGPLGPR